MEVTEHGIGSRIVDSERHYPNHYDDAEPPPPDSTKDLVQAYDKEVKD